MSDDGHTWCHSSGSLLWMYEITTGIDLQFIYLNCAYPGLWIKTSWRRSTCWRRVNVITCAVKLVMLWTSFRKLVACC